MKLAMSIWIGIVAYTVPTTSASMTSDINTTHKERPPQAQQAPPSTEIKLCEPFIPAFTLYISILLIFRELYRLYAAKPNRYTLYAQCDSIKRESS